MVLEHLFQFLAGNAHLAAQRVETHGCKVVEILLHHRDGHVHILTSGFAAQLQQDAFPQVPCGDTGRVQCLDDLQHLFHLLGVHHVTVVECHVIGNFIDRAAQIAVILQIAHNGLGNDLLGLVELQFSQLVGKVFLERFFAYCRRRIVLVVAAAVVGEVAVPCSRVVVTVAVHLAAGGSVLAGMVVVATLVVVIVVLVVVVRLFFKGLNLIDLIVDEFGHLGIVFLQHQSQHALLFQCQALLLLLLQCQSLFRHCRKRFCCDLQR